MINVFVKINKYICDIKSAKCSIIIDEFSVWGGGTKPIVNYYKYQQKKNNLINFLVLRNKKSFLKTVLLFVFSEKILINGWDALRYYNILLLVMLKKDVILYLHTISVQYLIYFNNNRIKKFLFSCIAKNRIIACVSKVQQEYYECTFGAKHAHVIYNNIQLNNICLDHEYINIVMVGYYLPYKGVTFFSEIADYSNIQGKKWRFVWVGDGPIQDMYFSNNVLWTGELQNPLDVVKLCDVFFLSSYDDAFPLVCLEALSVQKKCVVYGSTGVAEIIKDISGCGVFENYDIIDAFNVLEKVIDETLDFNKAAITLASYASVESFSSRLDDLMNLQQ